MRTARRKWFIVSAYWIVQSILLVAIPVLLVSIDEYGFHPPSPSELLQGLLDPGLMLIYGPWILTLTALQAVLVFPWQVSLAPMKRGKSVKLSLALSGLLLGLLVAGFVVALVEAYSPELVEESRAFGLAVLGAFLLSWAGFSALLLAYCRRTSLSNDRLLTRVARSMFVGTVVESFALIPLHAMIRRKTDCYCFTGSFIMLSVCGAIGIIVAGPAFFLPLFARAGRIRRFAGKCPWCGYDRAGLTSDAVCPECGSPAPHSNAPGAIVSASPREPQSPTHETD